MATVLRVKRRNDDEPWNALLIACKKRKTDESEAAEANSLTAVVKFAGTVKNQEDNVVEHLTKNLTKDELKANYKQHVSDVTNKARLQRKEDSRESRYKVVNCFRSVDKFDIEEIGQDWMTVVDVEDANPGCAEESKDNKKAEYVYDLYYTQTEEDLDADHHFSISPIEQELVFDDEREKTIQSDNGDSEDSNSESNWKNDYPDSDHSENSIDENDMRAAVEKLKINGEESDLSSDESDFVYTVDEADVDNYGYSYARYKQKRKKALQGIDDDDDEDKSDDDSENSGVYISEIHSDEEEEQDDDN